MGYTENIGMAITIKSREPEKPPAKIHTDNSVNGYAAIYNSRNCFVSIHSRFRLTVQR